MTRPPVLFDDAVAVALEVLRTGFTARSITAPVHARIPSPRPAAFVSVSRIGGIVTDLVLDAATISIDAWGQAEDYAAALAEEARRLINSAGGVYTAGHVNYTQEIKGPTRMPDLESQQPRYTATYAIWIRGHGDA